MTGFTLAYAVVRVCGGQPRKNPGAPKKSHKKDPDKTEKMLSEVKV